MGEKKKRKEEEERRKRVKRRRKKEEEKDKEKRGSLQVLQPDGFWDHQTQDELRFKFV